MAREIKYRVWSKKYNKYFELSDLHYEGDKIDGIFAISGTLAGIPHVIFLEPEDVVLEQDTGLKDKNGKEIYEGDIVKFGDSIAVIIWRNKRAEFGVRWTDCGIEDSLSWQVETEKTISEVIGTIHENPELLK